MGLTSIEVEYASVVHVGKHLSRMWMLLGELDLTQRHTLFRFCDNQSTIKLIHNLVNHQKSKHIEIFMHYIKLLHAHGKLVPIFVPSTDQLADIFFTKYLSKLTFTRLCAHISIC